MKQVEGVCVPVANATNEIGYLTGFGGHFETEAVPGALTVLA